ncbi:MAG TPA: YibE/F family protein, partial [Dehalococcoidia bacterium]
LSHGINRKTTTALAGTAIALALTAVLASVSIGLARLSGLADDEASTLNIITRGGINAEGLLLAGMIIGALGVLDDVCVAQASAVFELRAANQALHGFELFERAMNIGRDHIASTVNTLFLAYAGAALPLLIILSLGTESASTLISREFLATEIVRTLVGSLGIVASVPLTTALAAWSLNLAPDESPVDADPP